MITSQETTNLMKAMVEAAPEISSVGKNKQAYGYKYATLDSLIDMLRAVLPKHGLWFMQMPTRNGEQSILTTRVFHTSGEWIEDSIQMTDTELSGKTNDTQKVGASITYFRRYALSSIFGVAADEDVDGNLNSRPQTKTASRTANAAPQPAIAQPLPPQPALAPPQTPEAEEAEKQAKAAKYLNDNYANRLKQGEPPMSILKDYADLLKTDVQKPPVEMTPTDVRVLARALAERDRERRKSAENKAVR